MELIRGLSSGEGGRREREDITRKGEKELRKEQLKKRKTGNEKGWTHVIP